MFVLEEIVICMDQSPGSAMAAAPAGTFLPLNEQEQRCYSALFTWCQADSAGTLSAARVAELFRASQLPADTLRQVMEVCGAKQQGYFGPTQFQLVLKLLSAAQSGLPVRLESIKGELPLPRFTGMKNYAEDRYPAFSQHGDPRGPHFGGTTGQTQRWAEDRSALRHRENSVEKQEAQAVSRSPRNSPPASPSNFPMSAYSSQRNGGADTLLSQSVHSPPRSAAQQDGSSPSHRGSRPPVEQHAVARAYSAERLVDHNAEDYPDDPWRITEEQLEYYTNQFKSLQPDLGALILGAVAKDFFTKSKLPIPELSFIWELSDVDRDGALTFREFCTAFHLIVARKNGFPLPESLPPSLQASLVAQDGAPPRPVGEDSFFGVPFALLEKVPVPPEKTEPLISFEETETIQQGKPRVEKQSSVAEMNISKHDVIEEPSQCVSTPKRVGEVQDKCTENTNTVTEIPDLVYKVDPHMRPRSRPRSYSSTSISDVVKKTEVPPTPPPRQQKTHSRASSLDLNKLFQHSSQGLKSTWLTPPPPALPPRPPVTQMQHFTATAEQDSQKALQQPDFADFSKFQEEEKISKQNLSCDATVGAEGSISPKTGVGLSQPLLQKPTRSKHRLESQNLDPSLSSFPAFVSGNKPSQKGKTLLAVFHGQAQCPLPTSAGCPTGRRRRSRWLSARTGKPMQCWPGSTVSSSNSSRMCTRRGSP
ncbi:ralBP1-associated Eps domain-containing protein 2-like isoform X2 [Scleropages formosus]|uniref:ralBP1-associated Eps domain-containing protein 2-like isoform X2 n=1 Tax=Scleropages formosus TaxID=113540 RepID=UPI00087886A1|nr:ralBP1-associated Eps domain-containing protein 2-like isoform X2 [Scleropages formosus]